MAKWININATKRGVFVLLLTLYCPFVWKLLLITRAHSTSDLWRHRQDLQLSFPPFFQASRTCSDQRRGRNSRRHVHHIKMLAALPWLESWFQFRLPSPGNHHRQPHDHQRPGVQQPNFNVEGQSDCQDPGFSSCLPACHLQGWQQSIEDGQHSVRGVRAAHHHFWLEFSLQSQKNALHKITDTCDDVWIYVIIFSVDIWQIVDYVCVI